MNARGPDSRPSSPAVSSPNGARKKAVSARYSPSLEANRPTNHMNRPVTIGYSSAPFSSDPSGRSVSTSRPFTYGKVWSLMPRPTHSCWTSE